LIDLEALPSEVLVFRVCAAALPLGPRPVLRMSFTARILIASQAPGAEAPRQRNFRSPITRMTACASGWGFSGAEFYDAATVATVPMGLCWRRPNT
jgi:hypothetical protein